jgi:putative oxidoreductase
MFATKLIELLVLWPNRLLGGLTSAVLAVIRLWAGWEFFKSGWLKVTSWESTLFLFREEYHVPLLPSHLAAVLGTGGELAFPVLLWVGLGTRLSALGLSAVNVMAVVAYAHVLLAEGFEAALGQHYLWGFALLVVAVFGPGSLSIDRWLIARRPRPRLGAAAAAA